MLQIIDFEEGLLGQGLAKSQYNNWSNDPFYVNVFNKCEPELRQELAVLLENQKTLNEEQNKSLKEARLALGIVIQTFHQMVAKSVVSVQSIPSPSLTVESLVRKEDGSLTKVFNAVAGQYDTGVRLSYEAVQAYELVKGIDSDQVTAVLTGGELARCLDKSIFKSLTCCKHGNLRVKDFKDKLEVGREFLATSGKSLTWVWTNYPLTDDDKQFLKTDESLYTTHDSGEPVVLLGYKGDKYEAALNFHPRLLALRSPVVLDPESFTPYRKYFVSMDKQVVNENYCIAL